MVCIFMLLYFSLTKLSIKFIELATEGASVLGKVLMMNPNITSLNLRGSIRCQATMDALHGNLSIPLMKVS